MNAPESAFAEVLDDMFPTAGLDERERLESSLLAGMRDGAWLDEQKFPPLNYAVDGLIPEGFSMLVGPPKAGKSWLILSILLAVASPNGYVLGRIPAGSGRRVFYLALEDGDRRMQDRCRSLLSNRGSIPPLFHYQTRIMPGAVIATIEAFMARYPDTALVVVDTLGKIMPPARRGEGAYERDYRVAGTLKRIADTHPGLAIVAVHHDRKAASEDFVDSVSGTHGLAGASDTIVVLSRVRHADAGVLSVTGRDVEEESYALTMTEGVWTLDGADLATSAKKAAARRETDGLGDRSADALRFVGEHPEGVRPKDVAEALGIDNQTAGTVLGRLFDAGKLSRPSRGRYAPVVPVQGHVESVESGETREGIPALFNTSDTFNTAA